MVRVEDHFGEKYHRLTVAGYDHKRKKYIFKCDCGNDRNVVSATLRGRISRGWDIDKAVSEPIGNQGRR